MVNNLITEEIHSQSSIGSNDEVIIQEWIETAYESGKDIPEPKGWLICTPK
jgi:hypothetical protein